MLTYKNRRILTALTLFILAVPLLAFSASAEAMTSEDYMDALAEKAFSWYMLLCKISVPLMILSFASCGFQLIASVFLKSQASSDNVKKQFLITAGAVAVLLLLPWIVSYAKSILEPVGWQPPTATASAALALIREWEVS